MGWINISGGTKTGGRSKAMDSNNMDKIPRFQRIGRFLIASLKKLDVIFIKTHYHEHPILNDKGEIIGHEFYTTRGGKVVRNMKKEGDESDANIN